MLSGGYSYGVGIRRPVKNQAASAPPVVKDVPYFIGVGAITVWLPMSAAVVDPNGLVLALPNQGSAGSTFDVTVTDGTNSADSSVTVDGDGSDASLGPDGLAVVDGCMRLLGASSAFLRFANPLDLVGLDFGWVMAGDLPNGARLTGKGFGADPLTDSRVDRNDSGSNIVLRRVVGGTNSHQIGVGSRRVWPTAKALHRLSLTASQAAHLINRVSRSAAHTMPSYPISDIGRGLSPTIGPLTADVGDFYAVDKAHPEAAAALIAIEALVAAKHGITLA